MRGTLLSKTLTFLLTLSLAFTGCGKDDDAPPESKLHRRLESAVATYALPGMAGVLLDADGVREIAAVGVRRIGFAAPLSVNDRFHLGSNVKAMTADLLAMEVEAGRLAWDRTLGEIFPEQAATMRAEYRDVTLTRLLQHRAGILTFETIDQILTAPEFTGTLQERRQAFAAWLLQQPPEHPVGQYGYSNGGYALAGAILERITGEPWEDRMRTRLWAPLGITTGGFGWPAAGGAAEPWGHVDREDNGIVTPHDPDTADEQFPDIFRPAGDAYMSLGDYAKFARLHLRGLTGRPELLTADTFARLHMPNGAYALGWGVAPLRGVATSNHLGSAGTFVAGILLQPDLDRGVLVATNSGTAAALEAVVDAGVDLLPTAAEAQ